MLCVNRILLCVVAVQMSFAYMYTHDVTTLSVKYCTTIYIFMPVYVARPG